MASGVRCQNDLEAGDVMGVLKPLLNPGGCESLAADPIVDEARQARVWLAATHTLALSVCRWASAAERQRQRQAQRIAVEPGGAHPTPAVARRAKRHRHVRRGDGVSGSPPRIRER